MKGLILAAGLGTRLRPLTLTLPKPLLPIANKPTLVYAIETMREAGITDIGIVVGATGHEVAQALGDGSGYGVSLSYIHQAQARGVAHAVMCAEAFVNRAPFMLLLGDTLYDAPMQPFVREFETAGANASLLVSPVANPSRYGIVETDGDRAVRLTEKPAEPKSNLALAGIYLFDFTLWDVLPKLTPSKRGELEITDAAQLLVEAGLDVRAAVFDGWWHDTGTAADMFAANEYWLNKTGGYVDPTAQVDASSHIITPVAIGPGCVITESVIGPYVSLGPQSRVEGSLVRNCVAVSEVDLRGGKFDRLLLGRRVQMRDDSTYGIVGDDTKLKL